MRRAIWPCRLHAVAALVAPLLAQPMPTKEIYQLLVRIPSL